MTVKSSLILGPSHVNRTIYGSTCRSLASEGTIPELAQMKGKPFLGALAAETLTANTTSLRQVLNLARQDRIELWLPDGTGMGLGDSCMKSPHTHQPFHSSPAAQEGSHKGSTQQPAHQECPGSKAHSQEASQA